MPLNDHASALRVQALRASIDMHSQIYGEFALRPGVSRNETTLDAEDEIRDTAETLFAWLNGTTRITLNRGPITKQNGAATDTNIDEESTNMQLHDDEKCTVTVDTRDAKGFETADAIDWQVDNTDVATANVSDDGRSCEFVAGTPGHLVATVTDSATDPVLTATLAIDVVPAGTATISLTEGPVTKQ
jgi:hypothetical protein